MGRLEYLEHEWGLVEFLVGSAWLVGRSELDARHIEEHWPGGSRRVDRRPLPSVGGEVGSCHRYPLMFESTAALLPRRDEDW